MAAPFYSKMFNGIITGLNTYPSGYLSDYNVSRNLYFGTYSTQGRYIIDIINKVAELLYTNNLE
jgi:hypothetical protein